MPKLEARTDELSIRPVDGTLLPPPPARLRANRWENAGPAASNMAARHTGMSAAASAVRAVSEGLNEMVVDSSLRRWLADQQTKILDNMRTTRSNYFLVNVNYSLNTFGDGRFYKFERADVVEYFHNLKDLKAYLSPQRVYGPSMSQTRPAYIQDYFVYLIGELVGAKAPVG